MQYVNVLLWVLIIVLITAVLCTGIAILWVETQREKWFNEGRVFEIEETKGTRRQGKGKLSGADINIGEFIKNISSNRPKSVVKQKSKPTVTKSRRVKREKAGDLQKVLDDYEDGIYQRQADYSGMKVEKIVKRVSIYKPKSKRERTK